MQAPKMQDNRFGRQFGLALLVLGLISIWQEWPINLAYAFFGDVGQFNGSRISKLRREKKYG